VGSPGLGDEDLASVETSVRAQLGVRPERASVTFLGVAPIEVLRFDLGDECLHVSLGMSRRPMTSSDSSPVVGGPRAELAVRSRRVVSALGGGNSGEGPALWQRLAMLAAAPTVEGVVYREGMTVDLGEPLVPGSRCTGVVVGPPTLISSMPAEEDVRILQLYPATATELAWCRIHGAPALRERWATQRVDLLDLSRPAASVD
jgi:Suppressor of fused protein (SUFU)